MMKRILMLLLALVFGQLTATAAVSQAARSAVEAARSYGAAVRSCDMGWAFDSMYPPLRKTFAAQFSNRSGNEAANARRIMGLEQEDPDPVRARQQALARQQDELKALRNHYVNLGRKMVESGVKIESFSVREPWAEYELTPPSGVASAARRDEAGRLNVDQLQGARELTRLVVLPTTVVVSSPAPGGGVSRVEIRSHIFAIRDEKVSGAVDRNGMTSHDTKLNKWYFVDANTDVNLLRSFFPNLPLRIKLPDGGERVLR